VALQIILFLYQDENPQAFGLYRFFPDIKKLVQTFFKLIHVYVSVDVC